jgi:hypothetical protein
MFLFCWDKSLNESMFKVLLLVLAEQREGEAIS